MKKELGGGGEVGFPNFKKYQYIYMDGMKQNCSKKAVYCTVLTSIKTIVFYVERHNKYKVLSIANIYKKNSFKQTFTIKNSIIAKLKLNSNICLRKRLNDK